MNKNKNSAFLYILVFLLLSFSGNPFIHKNVNADTIYITFSIVCIILCLWYVSVVKISSFLKYIIPFCLVFLVQSVMMPSSFSSNIFVLMKMFIGFAIYEILKGRFTSVFVNTMTAIAAISIPLFLFNKFIGYLPGITLNDLSTSLIVYTEIFATDYFIDRNAGMFWEPGAFAGYINIALFFLLFLSDFEKKKYRFAILVAALLTTFSTTGYIVFAFLITSYFIKNRKLSIIGRIFIVGCFIAIAVYCYNTLDFLGAKIGNMSTMDQTDEGRLNDYIRFSGYLSEYALTGMSGEMMQSFNIGSSGNGFIGFAIRFGFVMVLYYWLLLFNTVRRQLSQYQTIVFVVMLFLLLQGEAFLQYPLFYALPFIQFNREKNTQKQV